MDLTREQIPELMHKHAEREKGIQDLLEMMLESIRAGQGPSGGILIDVEATT